jgi:hypothetical protein
MVDEISNCDSEEVLQEINRSLKLLVLANRKNIEKERNDFLGTGKNREILTLCNGKREIKEIAQKVGMTARAVRYVVDELSGYGLTILVKSSHGKAKLPTKL